MWYHTKVDGMWRFHSYTTGAGNKPVEDFLGELGKEEQAKVALVVQMVAKLWPLVSRPHVDICEQTERIYELRTRHKKVQIRILFWPDGSQERLIALHGFKKQKNKLDPRDIAVAVQRKKDWLKRRGER